jgi:hypothetical protein
MELQVVEVAEDQQVAEDLVAEEQVAHKQLITLAHQAEMEQVQVVAEIITQVETDKREVLA